VKSSDPLGKRALFEHVAAEAPEENLERNPLVGGHHEAGKTALFSTGPHRPGSVVLECSQCGVHTRMSAFEAGVRIVMLSAWVPPVKRHNRWMLCPECQERTWCRVQWRG
jgi:hypothetical protein